MRVRAGRMVPADRVPRQRDAVCAVGTKWSLSRCGNGVFQRAGRRGCRIRGVVRWPCDDGARGWMHRTRCWIPHGDATVRRSGYAVGRWSMQAFSAAQPWACRVLKRLHDARAAGDRVYGVVAGNAVNQDGRSTVLTAPNGRRCTGSHGAHGACCGRCATGSHRRGGSTRHGGTAG